MRLLLDTHVFLWLNGNPGKLSTKALDACADPHNQLYLSLVSLWEIQIKSQLGKLHTTVPWQKMLATQRSENGLKTLGITEGHIEQLGQLHPHHKDPFDRLLFAQAKTEQMVLVTADKMATAYELEFIW